jgi:hypothetical protein
MSSVIPGRRRAEEFAALVDGRSPGTSTGDPLLHADLLRLVADLRELPTAAPRPEFVTSLRASLMAAADEALVSLDARLTLPVTTRSRRDRRVAITAGAIALVGATSSMAVAAQSALPGDALYPIKRVLESAETSLAADDSARADKVIDNATGRLDEMEALSLRNSAESQAALPNTLNDFVTQANQAGGLLLDEYADSGDARHITDLRAFISASLDRLAGLDAVLPAAMRDEVARAVEALLTLDMRALALCPSCGSLLDLPFPLLPSSSAGSQPTIGERVAIAAPTSQGQSAPNRNAIDELLDKLKQPSSSTQDPATDGTKDGTGDGDDPALPTDPVTEPVDELTGTLLETLTSGSDPLSTLLDGVVTTVVGEDGRLLQ